MSTGNIIGYANEQQRKDQRRDVDNTFVVIDGNLIKVVNISLRGFLGIGYKGSAKVGDEIVVDEFVMADDSRVHVDAHAVVVRLDAVSKDIVASFFDMNSKTFDTLEKMIMLRPLTKKGGRLK